jgi:NADH dehydrogenase FAD-containing subunit
MNIVWSHYGASGDKGEGSESVSLTGEGTFYLWRSLYMSKLFSMRSKTLVAFDWMKVMVFGRDLSRADKMEPSST